MNYVICDHLQMCRCLDPLTHLSQSLFPRGCLFTQVCFGDRPQRSRVKGDTFKDHLVLFQRTIQPTRSFSKTTSILAQHKLLTSQLSPNGSKTDHDGEKNSPSYACTVLNVCRRAAPPPPSLTAPSIQLRSFH